MSMLQPQQDELDWSAARLDEQRLTDHRLPAVSQASAADCQIAAGVSSLHIAMHTGVEPAEGKCHVSHRDLAETAFSPGADCAVGGEERPGWSFLSSQPVEGYASLATWSAESSTACSLQLPCSQTVAIWPSSVVAAVSHFGEAAQGWLHKVQG